MAFSLTDSERAQARTYLGYPNLAVRYIVSSNIPVAVPTQEILEQNMRNILDEFSLEMVRELIEDIEESRCQIKKAKKRLKAAEIAYTFKSNPYEISQLWQEDYRLVSQLANALACPIYWHPVGKSLTGTGNYQIDINWY